MDEHLYVVTYDIRDEKRWRRVFKLMNGYGQWLQLSVFQCRLTRQRHAELVALLDGVIKNSEDHLVLIDLGLAAEVSPKVISLGKTFRPIVREVIVV
ncbi:MAG: CRISPR-associated endonuclease Cas2 [bacterium]|jgi:CRISPR-associated protein Cas2